jgi:hypothetical protein
MINTDKHLIIYHVFSHRGGTIFSKANNTL